MNHRLSNEKHELWRRSQKETDKKLTPPDLKSVTGSSCWNPNRSIQNICGTGGNPRSLIKVSIDPVLLPLPVGVREAYPPFSNGIMAPLSQRRVIRLSYDMIIFLDCSMPRSHHYFPRSMYVCTSVELIVDRLLPKNNMWSSMSKLQKHNIHIHMHQGKKLARDASRKSSILTGICNTAICAAVPS